MTDNEKKEEPKLHLHQQNIVESIKSATGNMLFDIPTGAGKTYLMANATKQITGQCIVITTKAQQT